MKQLNINGYKAYFILGDNEDEKTMKREVLLNISLRFPNTNEACCNDNLDDTVCYASLLAFLESRLRDCDFNLIEKATQFVYDTVREFVDNDGILLRVELIKPNPSVENLESSSFILSDWD